MKIIAKCGIIFDRIMMFMVVLAGVLLYFASFSIGVGVLSRYVFHRPISWILEVSEYSLVYITFLIVAWVLKKEGHVRMDFVLNFLSPRSQSLVNVITYSISMVVCLVFGIFGVIVTLDTFQAGVSTGTLMSPPLYIFLAIIGVGYLALALEFVRKTYHHFISYKMSSAQQAPSIVVKSSDL